MAHSEWTDADLNRLARQAKQAYETKQLKNCQTYTNILLQVDPCNATALELQSAIQSEIEHDLEKARELLSNPHLEDQPEVFGRGAEILLSKILNLDPDNDEARMLAAKLNVTLPAAGLIERDTFRVTSKGQMPAPDSNERDVFRVIPKELLPPAAEAPPTAAIPPQPRMRTVRTPTMIAVGSAVVLVVLVVLAFEQRAETRDPEVDVQPIAQVAARPVFQPTPAELVVAPAPAPTPVAPRDPVPVSRPMEVTEPTVTPPTPRPTERATRPGSLAISSRTAADIYEGNKYLGSTPMTLELTPGPHTLEYRHQGLRKVVTYNIASDRTETAMITFEKSLQINAKPWANVFVDGAQRRALGQTPLSDVRVPVGGTLVFENPNFTQKRYRVTGQESAIQVVFP